MLRRRDMFVAGDSGNMPDPLDIVHEGLIFRLNGKKRGGIVDHWIDEIHGVDFLLHSVLEEPDGVLFAGHSQSFGHAQSTGINTNFSDSGTFQIVLNPMSNTPSAWFTPNGKNAPKQFSVGVKDGNLICNNSNVWGLGQVTYPYSIPSKQLTISVTNEEFYENMALISNKVERKDFLRGNADGVGISIAGQIDTSNSTIHSFNGKIYEIRIYNRKLTKSEVLKNQDFDIKTYFGGVIP